MTRHLGMQVSAYVDRRLDAPVLHAFDQHVAVCLVCRYAAEEERKLLTSLRSGPTPGFSPDLQSMLLALAQPTGPASSPLRASSEPSLGAPSQGDTSPLPPIPTAPPAVRQLRVPTVPPAAPALHRSPRRAAAIAGLAAGASAVAAIGLAVAGPSQGAAATVRPVTPRTPGATAVTAVPVQFGGPASSPLRQALQGSGR